jgi:hypothetical protein
VGLLCEGECRSATCGYSARQSASEIIRERSLCSINACLLQAVHLPLYCQILDKPCLVDVAVKLADNGIELPP